MGLKSIAGLVTPDCGRILLGDKTFYSSAERINRKPQLRKTGYLFQSYALFPNMTVAENVGSGISPKNRERDKIISACIHRFRLSGLEIIIPANCREDSSKGPHWPAYWPVPRLFCCWMNLFRPWMPL